MKALNTTKQELLSYLLIFIALCPILILRDYTPDNELKYLSIADEAIENGNFFAFYYQGAVYADKPPLYLWLIMGAKALFGRHINFIIYLFSFIPALVSAFVMNRWCSKVFSGNKMQAATPTIMLFSSAFFLAAALVARMDMLMTMFIILSLYSFYQIFQQSLSGNMANINRWKWLFPIYTFLALFTKGPLGLMIPFASIIVFLLWERKFGSVAKQCFGWRTWLVLITLPAIWFLFVWTEGGNEYLNNLLFHQTVDRAVDAFYHKEPIWYYMARYWYMTAPWCILIAVAVIKGWFASVSSSLERMFLTVFLTTLVILSFISSKLEIYLLPALPFIIYLAALKLKAIESSKLVKWSIAIPAAIFILTLPAAAYALLSGKLYMFETTEHTCIIIMTALLAAGGVLAIKHLSNTDKAIKSIGISLLTVAFAAGLLMNRLNIYIGAHYACTKAYELAKESGLSSRKSLTDSNTICFYKFRAGKNFDTFFKQMLKDDNTDRNIIKDFKMRELSKDELKEAEDVVIIYKTKDIKKDTVLAKTVAALPVYNVGAYSVSLKLNN